MNKVKSKLKKKYLNIYAKNTFLKHPGLESDAANTLVPSAVFHRSKKSQAKICADDVILISGIHDAVENIELQNIPLL